MVFFAAVVAFVAANWVNIAISIGLSLLSSAIRKKPKTDTGAIDAGQMLRPQLSFGIPRGILLGQRAVGGTQSDRFSYGPKNENLVSISVLSSRPCSDFVGLKVFGEDVTLSGDPTQGEVSVTSHFKGRGGVSRMFVRVFLGEDNSGFPAYINSLKLGRYDASDVGGKMTIVVWRAVHTNDDVDSKGKSFIPWTNGPPECRWEMKGAKLFDPRVIGASLLNMASWTYTHSPLLHDFAIDLGIKDGAPGTPNEQVTIGNSYPLGLLDVEHVKAMADWSDLRDYGSHGVVRSGQRGDQEEIWKSFNGQRLERPASVLTMPEAARPHYGAIDVSTMPAVKISAYDEYGESTEVPNRMAGYYAEPLEGYGRKDLPSYTRAEWHVADNNIPRESELGLHFVTKATQGAELIKQEAEIARHPATLSLLGLDLDYGKIPLGTTIDLVGSSTPAVNNRRWIVEQISSSASGPVSLGLRVWPGDDNLLLLPTDTQPSAPIPPSPRPWPWWPDDGIDTIPPNLEVDDLIISGRGSIIAESDAQNANIAAAATTGAGGALSMSVDPSFTFGQAIAGTITSAPVTVTASNGSGGEGYAWTHVSGDVLTVDSPNAAATTFSGVTIESLSAVYKCVVTDSAGATAEINVNISLLREYDFGNNL